MEGGDNHPSYISRMKETVISFPDPTPCVNRDSLDRKEFEASINSTLSKRVRALVDVCIKEAKKFEDKDFGPQDDDEYGAKSLYGDPPKKPGTAGSSKYPDPQKLRWARPEYRREVPGGSQTALDGDDEVNSSEDEDMAGFGSDDDNNTGAVDASWCKNGALFLDGTSSGDVVQGTLVVQHGQHRGSAIGSD